MEEGDAEGSEREGVMRGCSKNEGRDTYCTYVVHCLVSDLILWGELGNVLFSLPVQLLSIHSSIFNHDQNVSL